LTELRPGHRAPLRGRGGARRDQPTDLIDPRAAAGPLGDKLVLRHERQPTPHRRRGRTDPCAPSRADKSGRSAGDDVDPLDAGCRSPMCTALARATAPPTGRCVSRSGAAASTGTMRRVRIAPATVARLADPRHRPRKRPAAVLTGLLEPGRRSRLHLRRGMPAAPGSIRAGLGGASAQVQSKILSLTVCPRPGHAHVADDAAWSGHLVGQPLDLCHGRLVGVMTNVRTRRDGTSRAARLRPQS